MFEILSQLNTFRIDYFTDPRIPQPEGVGLYVNGALSSNQPYSREAKQALVVGLCLILRCGLAGRLAVVYVDITSTSNLLPPAYAQMKQDLRRGFIQCVLVANPPALQRNPALHEDWKAFRKQHSEVR
ncbi:MAG: hypothetical protein ACPLUL_13440 [Thermanaerothrix sp.]|uniref:hypothetical protein n=1 Tax=Thermanaerothrix sp. TaxID=2972675 RepID=UPI003C7E6C86